jgi:4-amino-4-deoxy-L-arabinose transferase-like glycosyltransferase
MARNVLEQHVFSHESEPPFAPSLIRLPGYPLFLAGVYAIFGHGDNAAVRATQALIDTATCGLIALTAYAWDTDEKRRRRSAIAALALAAICPFTTIYVATILTETISIFLTVAMCLLATLALQSRDQKKTLLLWLATGLVAGVSVLFRPDSGLFALAIGLTLVVAMLTRRGDFAAGKRREEILYRTARASYLGAVFSLAFALVLVPWTIRNYRVFHLFQPLAPAHAEMPGEFVPRGYLAWLRTWIDNGRYIGPVLWSLDEAPIKLSEIPESAFDSADEEQRVAALLAKYNQTEDPGVFQEKQGESDQADKSDNENENDNQSDEEDNGSDEENDEEQAAPTEQNTDVEMTPEIDAGFAQIARERIARHPVRYYVLLPLKRAHSLWFDTHSQYYPFEGDLLPLEDLDYSIHQQFWLPLFALLTLIYSVLGAAGAWFLLTSKDASARIFVLLVALMIFIRIGFFATLENPEPRYVVEVFPLLAILGGIALTRLTYQLAKR